MVDTFASLNAKIRRLEKELGDDALMHSIGKMAKDEASKAARADIGDESMSGWKRSKPIELVTRYDIVGKGKLSFHPSKRSSGPWTVMEQGRNAAQGPRIRSSSLTPTGRKRSAKAMRRWNGVTQGKGTASDAVDAIESKVPKLVQQHVPKAIRRAGLR